jgi:hypothetical protein
LNSSKENIIDHLNDTKNTSVDHYTSKKSRKLIVNFSCDNSPVSKNQRKNGKKLVDVIINNPGYFKLTHFKKKR